MLIKLKFNLGLYKSKQKKFFLNFKYYLSTSLINKLSAEKFDFVTAEDLENADKFFENKDSTNLNLSVKYLVDYKAQNIYETKDELLNFIFAIHGQVAISFYIFGKSFIKTVYVL